MAHSFLLRAASTLRSHSTVRIRPESFATFSGCYAFQPPLPARYPTECRRILSGKLRTGVAGYFIGSGRKMSEMSGEDPLKNDRIVWVDLEMSGLDVDTQTIVEMACIVTDGNLNIVAESPNLIINHPESVLTGMSDWCKNAFAKSGLLTEIRSSKLSLMEAEGIMLAFVRSHTNAGKSPLAGNTVYMDRMFLRKYMPAFDAHMHYRLIDVSSIKELSRRWYPKLYEQQPSKALAHRAMQDIKDSINELQWYRRNVFRMST